MTGPCSAGLRTASTHAMGLAVCRDEFKLLTPR
jgi:hypothetical protein